VRFSLLFILGLVTASVSASAEGPLGSAGRPIHDATLRAQFQKRLSTMKKEEQTVSPGTLLQQLNERRQIETLVELPQSSANLHEPNPFRRAKAASLVFGKLYLCGKCDKWHPSLAGAVVISPDGLVVTNHHVLDGDNVAFGGMTADGAIYSVEEVLVSSEKRDVALVRLALPDGVTLAYAELGEDADIGEDIFVVGHPNGRFYSFTQGVVSRYYQQQKKRKSSVFMQITADFAKGSSGSGVFDHEGKLVGLVASTNSIYYDTKDEVDSNLQMVVKVTAPVRAIRELLAPATE